jgi:hypothetical protein
MQKTRKRKRDYYSKRGLSADEVRWNRTATVRKGRPGSKQWKRYVFGHKTNVRKGRV